MDEFYVQDKRSYVGNDILFWADGGGYTTDVSKAEVFTKERAIQLNKSRSTDIPWPKDYIDGKTRPAVDMQYINIKEALKDTGVKLAKPPKPKREVYECWECGRFLSGPYETCGHCGCDNLP